MIKIKFVNLIILFSIFCFFNSIVLAETIQNEEKDINKFSNIIAKFSNIIKAHPDNYQAYFNRGYLKMASNDYKGALSDYDTAIKLNPNFAAVYLYRGVLKDKMKDFSGAINDYNTAILLDSTLASKAIIDRINFLKNNTN